MSVATDDRSAIDDEHAKLAAETPGGQTLDQMAADEEGGENEQLQLLDFGDALNLTVRGRKPTDSEIKIKAISRPIKGQLGDANDDEVVTLLVTARLDGTSFIPKRNGDGDVIAKTRRHTFTPISVFPIDKEQADRALGLA